MSKVKFFTSKDTTWVNANGDKVPLKFVPKSDKTKELLSAKIYKASIEVEAKLKALHVMMKDAITEIDALVRAEFELKNGKKKEIGKGCVTYFSFDRSVKIEADINDIVKWDDLLMKESHALLNAYISKNLSDANILISGLVKSAYSNSKNTINTAKVFEILKYEEQIKDKGFQKACELIKQAQSIDRTKLYMRVWVKEDDGSYNNVNLNFSAI